MTASPSPELVDGLRRAFADRDLEAFGALLADDVRWGDEGHPRSCRNRADVLDRFGRLLDLGVDGTVMELSAGPIGVLCELTVVWPEPEERPDDHHLYHCYMVRDGRISEIRRFDDRRSAAEAVGLSAQGGRAT